jgi:pimeloyl-ACP methyl ester carboxylesterase
MRTVAVLLAALGYAGCAHRSSDAGDEPAQFAQVKARDGATIAYEVRGSGPPLVFVHGWSCDRSYWREQVDAFARYHEVVAIDLPGHGAAGTQRSSWTIEAFGADVATVMERLDLKGAVLVGHSMGSNVVLEAMRQAPDRVAGLVWVDAYRDLDKVRDAAFNEAFMKPFKADFAAATRALVRWMFPAGADGVLVEGIASDMAAAPPDVALATMAAALGADAGTIATLERPHVPVIAINPDAPPSNLHSMNRRGVEVLFMSGVGHFPMLEKPAVFNARLADALNRIARPSPREQ